MSVTRSDVARVKTCPECGAGFLCGPRSDTGNCWCDELPALIAPKPDAECLCPDCLKAELTRKIAGFIANLSPQERGDSRASQYARQDTPPVEGMDFYWENGYMVFTEWYHLKRGSCCANGCRHCPYGK